MRILSTSKSELEVNGRVEDKTKEEDEEYNIFMYSSNPSKLLYAFKSLSQRKDLIEVTEKGICSMCPGGNKI